MFCAIRLFVEKGEEESSSTKCIDAIAAIIEILTLTCNVVKFTISDPDHGSGYIFNKKIKWKEINKNKSGLPTKTCVIGEKTGFSSSLIVTAFDKYTAHDFFNFCIIRFVFPIDACALKIGIDYDVSYGKRVDMNVYTEIIRRMNQLGFRVNNSFVHVYKKKKESMSIDGVMWGHCSLQEKVAADRFIVHHLCEFKNHIMDVYCANSIQNSALNDKDLSKIREIVGEENVRLVDDSLVFSLPNMVKHTVLYRIKYSFIIQRLRAVFHL